MDNYNFDKQKELSDLLGKISGKTFEFIYMKRFGVIPWSKSPNKEVPIGGCGITKRPLKEIISKMDRSIGEDIRRASSIIIFGNGLSLAPIELKRMYPDKKIALVDMIDYREFVEILRVEKGAFEDISAQYSQYYPNILSSFFNAEQLIKSCDVGEITIYNYVFGGGGQLKLTEHYELGINSYGPPRITIPEQFKFLSSNASLYYKDIGSSCSVIKYDSMER